MEISLKQKPDHFTMQTVFNIMDAPYNRKHYSQTDKTKSVF